MAPRFRLSSEIAEGIEPLVKLPIAEVHALAQELEQKLPVKLAIEEDVAKLIRNSSSTKRLSPDDQLKLSEAITGLHLLRFSTSKDTDEVVSDIVEKFKEMDVDGVNLDAVRENLTSVLAVRVLQASVKAWTLIDDHDTIYLTSRIITDIRPVFDEDLTQPLKASLVTHTLKVMVRTDGRAKQLYVVGDSGDLKELRDNIDRALAKGAALTQVIRNHPEHWFGASLGEDAADE